MRTEELIDSLAREPKLARATVARALALALITGAAAAFLIFMACLGLRPDFATAILTPWYPLKIAVLFGTAVLAAPVVEALARPGAKIPAPVLLMPLAALAVAIVGDLLTLGTDGWAMRLQGKNGLHCISLIPFFSAVPLVTTLAALRYSAPTRPFGAGVAAGLLSGAIGGLLYGLYCPDDSPLFVALWYPIGIGLVMLAGGLAGRVALRW